MDDAIPLDLELVLHDPAQIRPADLSPAFRDARIACLSHDLSCPWGHRDTLVPTAPCRAWTHMDGRISTCEDVSGLPGGALAALAALAAAHRTIAPFEIAAEEMDPDLNATYRVFYYPVSTIVCWADLDAAEQYVADAADAYAPFSIPHLLGTVYAATPASHHERLGLMAALEREVATHIAYLNAYGPMPLRAGRLIPAD